MRGTHVRGNASAVAVATLALYAAVVVIVAARQGLGISVDSVYYAHGAESFAWHGEVAAFGLPLTLWPPGYPVLLGTALRLGLDVQAVALLVNVASVLATVVLTFLLGRETLDSPSAGLVAAAVVALSSSTVRVFAMLWTEPLFTALTLGAIVLLVHAVRRRQFGWGLAVGLGVLVSVATALRYVGVVLVPVVVVGALLALRGGKVRTVLAVAALTGSTASLGLVAIALRNVTLGVGPLGDRADTGLPLINVLGHSLRALGRYVLPETGGLMPVAGQPAGAAYVFVTGATIALGVLVALLLAMGCWWSVSRRNPKLFLVALFVMGWWGALALSTSTTGVDPPNERLLAPAFAPMVVLAVAGARRVLPAAGAGLSRGRLWVRLLYRCVPPGLLVVTLFAGIVVGVGATWGAARDGIGYNAKAIRSSPLALALNRLPEGATVASSDPWLAWWVARRDTTTIYDDALKQKVGAGEVDYLAFFAASTAPHRDPKTLEEEGIRMRLVETFADGILYEGLPMDRAR